MKQTLFQEEPSPCGLSPEPKIGRLGIVSAFSLDPRIGSGCAVATTNLVKGAEAMGVSVKLFTPQFRFPHFTSRRILFNELLRLGDFGRLDATVGIDLDGYTIPRSSTPHVANIKGVLGDAVRFESGISRANLAFQAHLEARHVHRADRVVTISRYCADNIRDRYRYQGPIGIVPEAIDLGLWRERIRRSGESRRRSGLSSSACAITTRGSRWMCCCGRWRGWLAGWVT